MFKKFFKKITRKVDNALINATCALESTDIEYVFECLNENTSKIRNIRQYLLTVLFNAHSTIDNYYSSLVNHDLYGSS